MASKRPEHTAPATEFYSRTGAEKYAKSSRINEIQTTLSERCVELLALPAETEGLILDVGCGTGISGDILSRHGHHWVGMDISEAMLAEALEKDVAGDLAEADAGNGVPFRMGCYDGVISVSAIQWLCNADRSEHNPFTRINAFFASLYCVLRKGARAVLQFYPENVRQTELLTAAAMRAGFSGGLLVDYPNSAKAKKYYLCLTAGPPAKGVKEPTPLGVDKDEAVTVGNRRQGKKGKDAGPSRRDWVITKKDRKRRQGHEVRADSRYTGRKRRVQF